MDKIVLSEYKRSWKNQFLEEAAKIKNSLHFTSVYIDHVGSTSVDGLTSKPIVDILLSISDWSEVTKIIDELTKLGFKVSEKCDDLPRYFLKKYNEGDCENYHLHVCEPHSRWGRDMLVFKNELISDPKLSEEYVELKKRLAKNHNDDIEGYIAGKKEFIENRLREVDKEFGVDRLLSHQRAESNRAEYLQIGMMITQFAISVLAAMSVYFSKNNELFWLAIAGFILMVIWFFLSQNLQTHRSASDQARRAILLISGLKIIPSAGQSLRISDRFNVAITKQTLRREEDHFSTREAPGYKRLVDMIEESSYWTCYLQKSSAQVMLTILLFLISIISIATGSAISSLNSDNVISLSRAMIALMIFIISSDSLGLFISYKNAAASIGEIFSRVESISERGYLASDALLLMADYNSAVEKAPITLPFIYKFCQKKLNKKWKAYSEGKYSDN